MSMIKTPLLIAAIAIGLVGCNTWEEAGVPTPRPEAQNTAATEAAPKVVVPAQVQLFEGTPSGLAYEVIQDIKVAVNKTTVFNADPTVAQVQERLRKSAAALGGDAVINVDISEVKVRAMSWGGRTGTGTVVRLK